MISGIPCQLGIKLDKRSFKWLYGRFNEFSGHFSYDEKQPAASKITVDIKTASLDSNHAERDKHLRSKDFLNVDKYPDANFTSTAYKQNADGSALLEGKLTLHGVTKPIRIEVQQVGHGDDPWGGYRHGFEGTTRFALADFGIVRNLGPASKEVEMTLSIEGIRQ